MRNISAILALILTLGLIFSAPPSVLWAQPEDSPANHAAAADGDGGHGAEGYSPAQWKDFGWRVVNFTVYALILFFLLRGPVSAFFSGRRENISRTLEYLETQSRNLDERNQVMTKRLSALSLERREIITQYERDGAKERDRIIAEAQRTAELIIQRTEAAMEAEIRAARQALTAEAGELAKGLAKDLLAERITGTDRGRLALEFVEQVVKLPSRKQLD
jgi:F-type H+-transporting ATPase subunit b